MFTRFASVDDFFHAVMSEQRHYSQIKDEMLRWPCTEYALWLDDSSPDKKPFEVEFRKFLEVGASICSMPTPARPPAYWERIEPSEAKKHLYELFGLEWRPPERGQSSI
jgi:hypothetical protein